MASNATGKTVIELHDLMRDKLDSLGAREGGFEIRTRPSGHRPNWAIETEPPYSELVPGEQRAVIEATYDLRRKHFLMTKA